MNGEFLVYEHWRPDTDICFYVGKGKVRRSRTFEHRNSRYGRIVTKLARSNLSPIIKIIASDLSEQVAFALEVDRIAHWRALGVEIANYTDGGDGTSGRLHSDETKDKIRKKAIGRKWTPEQRAKIVGVKRGPRSIETRSKQSAAAKVAQKKRFAVVKKTKRGRRDLSRKMMAISRAAAIDPSVRAVRSQNAKALWADPVYREKVLESRRVSRTVVKGFS